MFPAKRFGKLFHITVEQIDKFHHDTGAALWVHGPPGTLRRLSNFYSLRHFGG